MRKIIIIESCDECTKKSEYEEDTGALWCPVLHDDVLNCIHSNTIDPDCPLQDASDLISKAKVVEMLEKEYLCKTYFPHPFDQKIIHGMQLRLLEQIQSMPGGE